MYHWRAQNFGRLHYRDEKAAIVRIQTTIVLKSKGRSIMGAPRAQYAALVMLLGTIGALHITICLVLPGVTK